MQFYFFKKPSLHFLSEGEGKGRLFNILRLKMDIMGIPVSGGEYLYHVYVFGRNRALKFPSRKKVIGCGFPSCARYFCALAAFPPRLHFYVRNSEQMYVAKSAFWPCLFTYSFK